LEVREKKLYLGDKDNNYKNVYEYAEKTLGFKKASTTNYIAICERFTDKSSGALLPEYSKYSYTQLAEALPIADLEKSGVTPDLTVKEIRTIKKALKKGEAVKQETKAPAKTPAQETESEDKEEPAVESITLTKRHQELMRESLEEIKKITFDKPFFALVESHLRRMTFILDGVVAG
jgi:hypothetical protein